MDLDLWSRAAGSTKERWERKFSIIDDFAAKWKTVNLTVLQKSQEQESLQVRTNQELSQIGRKNVGQKTKDFAKLPVEEKSAHVGSILKCYQSYIDEMAKYLKHVEGSYFQLRGAVATVVDPYALLARLKSEKPVIMDLIASSEECETTKRSLKDMEGEFRELKNQEVTIQKLREELAVAEFQAATNQSAQKNAVEESSELKTMLQQWQMREAQLQQEMIEATNRSRRFQSDNAELLQQVGNLRNQLDFLQVTRDQETDANLAEMNALNMQIATLERERVKLEARFQELHLHQKGGQQGRDSSEDVFERDYMMELQDCKRDLEDSEQRALLLQQSNKTLSENVKQLETTLETSKQEVEYYRQYEVFRTKLDETLLQLEISRADLFGTQNEMQALKTRVTRAEDERDKYATDVKELEKEVRDMMHAEERRSHLESSAKPFDIGQLMKGGAPATPLQTNEDGGDLQQREKTLEDTLSTITHQRDRYRQRLLNLEETTSQEMDALRLELKTLNKENEELHQYIRTNGESLGQSSRSIRIPGGASSNGRVAQIGFLNRMSTLLTRVIISNEKTRQIFLLYLLALHGVVLFTLMHFMFIET